LNIHIQGASVGDPSVGFELLAAEGIEPRIVRVIFSKQPRRTSPQDASSVDNPSNWSFTFELTEPTFPVCHINAKYITPVPDTNNLQWYIELDQDQSLDAKYTVHASDNINDIIGLPLEVSSLPFDGFRHALHINHKFELYLHMGSSSREDESEDQRKFLSMIQEVFNCLWAYADRLQTFVDPTQLPYGWEENGTLNWNKYVDRLLDDLGNPFNITMSLATKRKLVLILVALYKQKGTSYGIVNAIRVILGIEVEVIAYNNKSKGLGTVRLGNSKPSGEIQQSSVPWYLKIHSPISMALGRSALEHSSDPIWLDSVDNERRSIIYSFYIISPIRLSEVQRDTIERVVQYMKPSHTHLQRIDEPELPINHLALGKSHLGSSTKPWKLH
jgi:phage tail-like protein